jgi:hypothetical protein
MSGDCIFSIAANTLAEPQIESNHGRNNSHVSVLPTGSGSLPQTCQRPHRLPEAQIFCDYWRTPNT